MIAVIDYGRGNLRSVQKAFERQGFDARVTSSAQDLADAGAVVLPGVGAFRDCMKNLDRRNLIEPVKKAVASGKPFLGICLGLQVLFSQSEEFGITEGLGVFPGKVMRFQADMADPDGGPGSPALKVPQMGWNQIEKRGEPSALKGIDNGSYFYFVHSFYVAPEDKSIVATTTGYGIEYVSSVHRDNLFACQFHPEKSQKLGLQVLKNFGEMANEG